MSKLRKLYYVPLEKYPDRYTLQLEDWTVSQFDELGVDVVVVPGLEGTASINTGQVLDAVTRPIHCMKQIEWLLKEVSANKTTADDFILFEDMFHPGIESLAYLFSQLKYGRNSNRIPKVGMRCLAQTIDPDDFVHYTGMFNWMRKYEEMVNSFVDIIFVASTEMLRYMRSAGWTVPVKVTGLPFNKEATKNIYKTEVIAFDKRPHNVVFASRVAAEKQPDFLGAMALGLHKYDSMAMTYILSGSKLSYRQLFTQFPLLGQAVEHGYIKIRDGLSKEQYYNHLAHARVLFNCSLQDWVSNTASEADTFGCNLVFPAYRSFPEAFENRRAQMYIPWSLEDAIQRVAVGLTQPQHAQGLFSDSQNMTNSYTLEAINAVVMGLKFTTPMGALGCNPVEAINKQLRAFWGE